MSRETESHTCGTPKVKGMINASPNTPNNSHHRAGAHMSLFEFSDRTKKYQ